jgi:acetylglutamate kinase
MRVVDEPTLNVIEMALGEINQELVGLVNRFGAKAVGLNGQDGRFIHARRMALPRDAGAEEPVDLGLVGDVERIDPDVVHLLVSRGFIPVIMPIGVGADGTAYHINSDIVAGQLARTLHAEKLILMTNVPGVVDRDGKLAFVLTASDADALLRDGAVQEDMQPRLNAALAAVREGVRSVHIIDGGVPNALLLEVLTNSGVGTALRSDAGPHFLADSRSYFASAVDG